MENIARLETSYFPKPSEFLFARSASNTRCGELVVDVRTGFLDSSYRLIEQGQVEEGMELLVGSLTHALLVHEPFPGFPLACVLMFMGIVSLLSALGLFWK